METGLEAMEQEDSDYSRRQKISWLCLHLSRIKPKELFWRNILHFSPLVPDCQLRRTCMRWHWLMQSKTDWVQTTRKNPFCPSNFSGVASPMCKACVNISGYTLRFTGHNWVLSNWQSSAGLSFHVWAHCILLIIVFCFWRKGSRSGSESVWFPFLLISAIHIPGPLVKFQYYLKCSLSLSVAQESFILISVKTLGKPRKCVSRSVEPSECSPESHVYFPGVLCSSLFSKGTT